MLYTTSDFSREYEGSVRLIAGSDGVSRAVSGVGILDYELMPGLKNKYQRVNFSPDEIVLSTFLYAKDGPYLITEAVKYLVAKGTSGLIIKNVLHIPIPDQAIRYANARHYPVFLTTDDSLFFDSVIYEVKRHIEQLASIDFAQREIDALRTDVSPESIADASEVSTRHFWTKRSPCSHRLQNPSTRVRFCKSNVFVQNRPSPDATICWHPMTEVCYS